MCGVAGPVGQATPFTLHSDRKGRSPTLKYVIKRLLLIIPTMLLVSFMVFVLVNLTPADPGRIRLGADAPQEMVDQINHELGADRPLLVRYGSWVRDLLKGDLGKSYFTNRPVFQELMNRFPNTIKLALLGLVSAMIVGIPLGVLCAVRQYSFADYTLSTLAMFLAAMPAFWLALLLLLQFSSRLGWFPSFGSDTWLHFVLPTIPLTMGYGAGYLRYTRTAMLDTIRQDYIRTARAKGCKEGTVIWKHAFRNSMLTVVTITGMSFAGLLGGAFISESVFSISGVGMMGIDAIHRRDMPQILASLITIGSIFMIIMVIVDIMYAVLNPRIRAAYTAGNSRKKNSAAPRRTRTAEEIAALPDPVMPEGYTTLALGGEAAHE